MPGMNIFTFISIIFPEQTPAKFLIYTVFGTSITNITVISYQVCHLRILGGRLFKIEVVKRIDVIFFRLYFLCKYYIFELIGLDESLCRFYAKIFI